MTDANIGAYVELRNGVVLGALRNSLGRSSGYLARDVPLFHAGDVVASIVVGGITGYPRARISPLVLLSAYVPHSAHAGLRLSYLPKTRATGAHVLHLSLEYRF